MGHGDPPSLTSRECGDDVVAYVLGALEGDELARFEHHLQSCVVCPDELAAFQQVVDLLPVSVPERRAPRGLRRRLLAEVHRDARRHRGPRRSRSRRLPPFALPSRSVALGAVLAAVVIAVGGLELRSSISGGAQLFHSHVASTAASAEVRVSGGRAELVVHHFAPPASGQIYEVWLNRPHRTPQPTSALFSVTARGDGTVAVPGNLNGVQQVMVTREPAGGSRVPTRPATITVNLT
ncbi:MAG: anti-sigma factor domain-containing protein [Solirubrobacteraceae bacterium]